MRSRLVLSVVALSLLAAACTPSDGAGTSSSSTPSTDQSFAGTIDAPEFPDGLDWTNTAEPLTIGGLRGKIVVLDFWTYGCINCIHVIPDLKRLEAEFAEELVVVGVHSAKFDNEGRTENLVDIVQRYEIEHPVVNDKDFAIWSAWGASAWPTTAVVDPAGRVVGIRAGEGVYDALQPVISGLVAEFDAADAIDRTPIEYALEATTSPATPLRYPGKVLAVENRLFVADTGHHRIVEVDPDSGEVVAAWGSGDRGFTDATTTDAAFDSPQGLAADMDDEVLYVADVGNHAVRSIDLTSGEVATVVGSGERGWPPVGGSAGSVRLSSPWDVLWDNGLLYIANAGSHQIWIADLARDHAQPLIGSAREGTLNGPFATSELAQPSGLALSDRGELYFADSESSSIRVGLVPTATTELVVGGDANLFTFGDVDGVGSAARLQHPLGVALGDSTLYVADTYNSKIKRVDPANGSVASWLGGEAGWQDGSAPLFNEPGGLSYHDGTLWVADTNNHVVRRIDSLTGETTTLVLTGLDRFEPAGEFAGEVITLGPIDGAAGPATLSLNYRLPPGYKVNEDASSSVTISGGTSIASLSSATSGDLTGTDLPADVPLTLSQGDGVVLVDINLVYCAEDAQSLCLIDRTRYEIPLSVGPAGDSTVVSIDRTITATG